MSEANMGVPKVIWCVYDEWGQWIVRGSKMGAEKVLRSWKKNNPEKIMSKPVKFALVGKPSDYYRREWKLK